MPIKFRLAPGQQQALHKALALSLLAVMLSACATSEPASSGNAVWTSPLPPLMTPEEKAQPQARSRERDSSSKAQIQARREQQSLAAEKMLLMAEEAEGPEQQRLLLQAAETAQHAGRDHLTAEALARLKDAEPLSLSRQEQLRLTLLRAETGGFADRPLSLLNALPRPGPEHEPRQAARIWRLRSGAYLALGQTLPATQALVRREAVLSSERAVRANRQLIWRTLRSVPPTVTDAQQLADTDNVTRGWIRLAQIMLDLWLSPEELTTATRSWMREYPGHPAAGVVLARRPSAARQRQVRFQPPSDGKLDKIALLLPLTGEYATAATAVRDGFMVAFYARPRPRPDIVVYDTAGDPASINNLAQQAINAGADILVGPLTKEAVAQLAHSGGVHVPVLTLNYLEDGARAPSHFYQFGLSPEDEARQAATRAMRDGHYRALALVPRSNWGVRTLTAFNDELTRLGGALVEYMYYNPEDKDFSAPITQLLRYDRSKSAAIDAAQKNRRKTGAVIDATSITPLSAIRTDMDFIFLASKPEEARLIRPQLRFYRASAVPVYATSHVYSGSPSQRLDLDLDGIQFGDTPWTLAPAGAVAEARDQVSRLWPANHARYPRLYAMGYDAYALASQLAVGKMRGGFGFPGATGLLTLEDDGRISRGLQWARFGGGEPRLLSDNPSGLPAESDFR